MSKSLSTFIALRFIKSKSSNRFLSFITWVSMAGLIIGVASLVVVTSVLNGFEEVLTNRILGMVPHASVLNKDDGIRDWRSHATQLKNNDGNILGVAPFINTRGMSSINGKLHGSIINGIDYNYQGQVSILEDAMVAGSLDSLQTDKFNIVLGKTLVDERGLELGDDVSIMLAEPKDNAVGIDAKFYSFKLTGIFSVSKEIDNWMSFISMDDAAKLLGVSNEPQGLRLKLKDVSKAEQSAEKAKNLLSSLGITTTSTNWKNTHQSLYDSIQTQKAIMSLLLLFIILVAVFNVVSALIMMTTEKRSEIAILQTIGASKTFIVKIFVSQGVLIGLCGTLFGLILGSVIVAVISPLSGWINQTFNLGLFDSYYVSALPAKMNINELAIIAGVSIAACIIASVYPALRAAKYHPVDALSQT